MSGLLNSLREVWTVTGFGTPDMRRYAESNLLEETRTGIEIMSFAMLILVLAGVPMQMELGFSKLYMYGYLAVAALSLHVCVSVRRVGDLAGMYLLAITLLVISATAFVFIAHGTRAFSTLLFANVVLLFMAVPMVPWGAREAVSAIALIYLLLSLSVGGVHHRFSPETLLTLQFLMLGAATLSLLLVVRSVNLRRHDLRSRFDLERAHADLYLLSYRDPLTGAWNRRYMATALAELAAVPRESATTFDFIVLDIDRFKNLNDGHGHDVGDLVLKAVARHLGVAVRANGVVFRLGGDEFVVFHVGSGTQAMLASAFAALAADAALIGAIGGPPPRLSVGIASAVLTPDLDLEALYRSADDKLYADKAARRAAGDAVTAR